MSELYVTLDTFIYSLPKNVSSACTFTDNRGVIGYRRRKVASASENRSLKVWVIRLSVLVSLWQMSIAYFKGHIQVYLCRLILKIQ